MIGAAKMTSVGDAANTLYSVNLNPGGVFVASENGSASSSTVYSTVISGVGVFNYQWTITGSDITIDTPTSKNTKFSASGFNDFYIETAKLTVTDTGNANAETTKDINVQFEFEGR